MKEIDPNKLRELFIMFAQIGDDSKKQTIVRFFKECSNDKLIEIFKRVLTEKGII